MFWIRDLLDHLSRQKVNAGSVHIITAKQVTEKKLEKSRKLSILMVQKQIFLLYKNI